MENISITGLIRHQDVRSTRNIESLVSSVQANYSSLIYWKYTDFDLIPSSNNQITNFGINDQFIKGIEDKNRIKCLGLPPVEMKKVVNWQHHLVQELHLIPNVSASFSWFSALSRASIDLFENGKPTGYWMITRPDFYTSRYFLRITDNVLRKIAWKERVILVATRPKPHMVLYSAGMNHNLPVDHFFIGTASSLDIFKDLPMYLEAVISGDDIRQPCVNEFLIGQFFLDNDLRIIEFPLPYFIRRNSLISSFVPNGPNRFKRSLAALRIFYANVKLVFHLHKLLIAPNSLHHD